jgi:hypothetical protein
VSLLGVVGLILAALVLAWRWWRGTRRAGRTHRRVAMAAVVGVLGMQALVGTPAFGQGLFDCNQAPLPDRPASGMVGVLDPTPLSEGQPGSPYAEVGYAGLVWHTYGIGCGGVSDPNAVVDTWVGNELFNVAKNIVGATNGLHYALLNGDLLKPLDNLISTGSSALYKSVFAPLFGLVALVLAVLLFRHIWEGDLATIGKRSMWALAGLWFAAATYLTPLIYTQALDHVVINTTSAVQAGFLQQVGIDERNALPTDLHNQVLYQNWLRGEFGSPTAPQANQYGRPLLDAQTWTKQEVLLGQDAGSPSQKQQQYQDIASKLGSAYGYFQGVEGSRIGDGMLALVQALAFASFQLLAKVAILLAQVLLRMLILAGPVIGLVALVYHSVLRAVGRLAGSAMLNVVVISALAGIHTLVLAWLFDPAHGFAPLTQILLAALVTVVFLLVGKPVRRIGQMLELSVGGDGVGSRPSPGAFSRFIRRARRDPESSSDTFWEQVRSSDYDESEAAPRGSRFRVRPEADSPSVPATARRLDRDGPGSPPEVGQARPGGGPQPALPGSGGDAPRRPGAQSVRSAIPESQPSRLVDTAPVTEARWDRVSTEPILVPSRAGDPDVLSAAEPLSPRPAEKEVVQGRPVYVVYRPSRGLEVADDG